MFSNYYLNTGLIWIAYCALFYLIVSMMYNVRYYSAYQNMYYVIRNKKKFYKEGDFLLLQPLNVKEHRSLFFWDTKLKCGHLDYGGSMPSYPNLSFDPVQYYWWRKFNNFFKHLPEHQIETKTN